MADTGGKHTVRSFDDELQDLMALLTNMGEITSRQIELALAGIAEQDDQKAEAATKRENEVDTLEYRVDEACMRMLALRKPMADDLRTIVSAIRAAAAIERVSDHACGIGHRAVTLNSLPPIDANKGLLRLGRAALSSFKKGVQAYAERDVELAMEIWLEDEETDDLYSSLYREYVTYMLEKPSNISACTHLVFMAKTLERIGDHATTLAEEAYFIQTGKTLKDRPRGESVDYHFLGQD